MKKIKEYCNVLIMGILAGISIAIGGWLYIRTRTIALSSVTAAFLFPIGLILICNFGFFLYTGKICYLYKEIKNKNFKYLLFLLLGLLGNYLGATIIALVFSSTLSVPDFVGSMVETKLAYNWWQLLILGFFCGLLIYLAVEGFAKIQNSLGKYLVLIFCVAGFIICGFEHCIADMFYFALAKSFTLETFITILLIILGNSLGGLFIPVLRGVFDE